jgi:hypothetical protein
VEAHIVAKVSPSILVRVCVYSWNILHCCLDVVKKMEANHLKINN